MSLLDSIVNMFQPQQCTCLMCGNLYFTSLKCGLCEICARRIRRVPEGDLTRYLQYGAEYIDYSTSLFRYGDGVRERVLGLKFGGLKRMGFDMGVEMAAIADRIPVEPILIPIPLHFTRRMKRGYNQSEILAIGIASKTGWRIDTHILKRKRATHKNAKLSHERRHANVTGAFGIKKRLNGGNYLIIDDVMTTGSTAAECAGILKQAGAEWVGVMTYARAGKIK